LPRCGLGGLEVDGSISCLKYDEIKPDREHASRAQEGNSEKAVALGEVGSEATFPPTVVLWSRKMYLRHPDAHMFRIGLHSSAKAESSALPGQ